MEEEEEEVDEKDSIAIHSFDLGSCLQKYIVGASVAYA